MVHLHCLAKVWCRRHSFATVLHEQPVWNVWAQVEMNSTDLLADSNDSSCNDYSVTAKAIDSVYHTVGHPY
eukprot:1903877-Amphidinium_carterae.1